MIFVTIGTQEPFDRLVKAIDEVAEELKPFSFLAQVSRTNYIVKNMKTLEFINPVEFNELFKEASLIVSHAGMGTIISALTMGKPILIMPRLAKFGEHRNDHQLATAKEFDKMKYVYVAYNENELKAKLRDLLRNELKPLFKLGNEASEELLKSLRNFLSPSS